MARYPGFCGPSYKSQYRVAGAERCVNWFLKQLDSGAGPRGGALYPTPGTRLLTSLPINSGRGLFSTVGRLFAVSGTVAFEVSSTFDDTAIGAVLKNDNPATMASSGATGNQLFIVSGRKGYIFDLVTSVFTQVVDDVDVAGYIGGYFVALDIQTGTLKWSDLLDGLTWDALNIQQRVDAGDPWAGMWVGHTEIWLLGTKDGQVWGITGDADQPFAPLTGATLEYGLISAFAIDTLESAPAWLSQNDRGGGIVMRASGYQPQRISTDEIEASIRSYLEAGTAVGVTSWSYEEDGHPFFVLSFPNAGATWVYDGVTGAWHERLSLDQNSGYVALTYQYHAWCFNKHIVLDYRNGNVYEQSLNAYQYHDRPIRRMRQTPHVVSSLNRIYYQVLRLLMMVGVGTQTQNPSPTDPQVEDPQIVYQYSDDGGNTWGDEFPMSMGKIGEYNKQVEWDSNGSSTDRVDRIICSDPVPAVIIDAYIDFTIGLR